MMKSKWLMALVAMVMTVACAQQGAQARGDGLEVSAAWSRAVPVGAPVAAGFLTLRNTGETGDRLLSVRSDAAERVEIHEVRHEGGMARMRPLADGLPLAAGTTVELKPGGYHLMFITPREGAFKVGQRVEATLVFEGAGERPVVFEVRAVGAVDPSAHHGHEGH